MKLSLLFGSVPVAAFGPLSLGMLSLGMLAQGMLDLGVRAQTPVEGVAKDRRAGYETIRPADCEGWLSVLASDGFGGRGTGRPGYAKAAHYVAGKFAEWGLEPVGDQGTYFQDVPFELTAPLPAKSWIALRTGDDEVQRLAFGDGFLGEIAAAADKSYELVVVNASKAEVVRKTKLAGKAVLLVDRSGARRRGFSAMTMAIYRQGPGCIISVDDTLAAAPLSSLGRVRYTGRSGRGRQRRIRPNRYAVSQATAEAMMSKLGFDKAMITTKATSVVETGCTLHAHVEVETKKVFGSNVVAFLPGRDKELRKQIVGIGSHLDHIGTNARGQINNGADDDGSGTTGVLAVARAFAKNGMRPRRSLLFMCFAGEEMGLIGSRHYVENPIFPNEQMVAELQMDMIGRNEERVDRRSGEVTEKAADNRNCLHLVGTKKLSDELHELCLDINKRHIGFDFEFDEEGVFSRSDHANFARKNIPIAFFFTGFHPQYHRPNDTVDRIDFPKLARVARLCYLVGWELAERDARPKVLRTYEEAMRSSRRRR